MLLESITPAPNLRHPLFNTKNILTYSLRGGTILKNQFYKEKEYEFNITRECKTLFISCNRFVESIDSSNLDLMNTSFNLIINSCKNIRKTKAPLKYTQIHKDIKRICNVLMKIYRNIFHIFIDEIWTNKYKYKISEATELLKIPLNKIGVTGTIK